MKKSFLGMLAVASMLFSTSCANDEFDAPAGDEATVSFAVELSSSTATRAISDGLNNDILVMAVYDETGTEIKELRQEKTNAFNGGLNETMTVQLAKGQTYSFAFWAQNSECEAYDYADLKNIRVNYENMKANDETRDAFFGQVVDYKVAGNFEKEVTLKRPFAQLNFAVQDVEAAKKAGINISQSKVVVSEVAGQLNVLTGEVSGAQANVVYDLADVVYPAESLLVDVDKDGNKDACQWLAMNYLLVNDETTGASSANADIEVTITTDAAPIVIPVANVPVQRNWRTNIIGSLTSTGTFQIVVDPLYDGENVNGDAFGVRDMATGALFATLDAAIGAGATDIQLAEGKYTLNKGVNAANLKISGASKDAEITFLKGVSLNGANVTFENVTLVSTNVNYSGMVHGKDVTYNDCVIKNQIVCYSDGDAKSTFNNCVFEQTSSDWYNIWTYGSNVDFNNCVFNSAGKAALVYAESNTEWKTVNFTNCEFNASTPVDGKAAIEIDSSLHPYIVNIEGCTATGFGKGSVSGNSLYNLKKGTYGVNCVLNIILADGVAVSNGDYEISNANGLTWFGNEVNVNKDNFAGKTVKLTADIDLNNKLWEPIGQTGAVQFLGTFDGQNHTIKNLRIDIDYSTYAYKSAGFFGWLGGGAQMKNVTFNTVSVKGHHWVGAIAGYLEIAGTSIDNCHVVNATVSSTYQNSERDGDKAGGIVGYLGNEGTIIKNCTVTDSQIDAVRDAGQVVGAGKTANVENCTATNVTVSHNGTAPAGYAKDGENINNAVIGRVL